VLHTPALFRKVGFSRKLSFSLFRRYAEVFKPRYCVERRMGVRLLLDRVNKVDLHLLCAGVWEPDRIAYLRDLALRRRQGRRARVLDIGAHGGLYSLVLDRSIGFDAIVAIEPEAKSLAQLRANVMMNDLADKVEIVAKAASRKSGYAQFIVAHESNRGQSHLLSRKSEKQVAAILVETVAVDRIFTEKATLVVAKIDVEGHEDEVIGGMTETIKNNSVILQIERNDADVSRLDQLLTPLGLVRVHSIDQDHYYVKS